MPTTLSLVLSPPSLQRLHEALSCLAKFSEYVTLEATRSRLILSSLNSSRSAYGGISLYSSRFFESYQLYGTDTRAATGSAKSASVVCKFPTRTLLAVFRQRSGDAREKETGIEKCEIEINEGGGRLSQRIQDSSAECRLRVRMHCKHGVLKTYKLAYEDADGMHAVFDESAAMNRWTINARLLREYMDHFGPKAEQLDISVENDRAIFTSFTEKLIDGTEILKQPLQTSVSLSTAEFDDFTVEEDLHLSISVKDFKAIVAHADILGAPVSAMYSMPGRPMQVNYEREGLTAEFTLMTRGADIAPTPQSSARPANRPPPRQSPVKQLKTQLTQRAYNATPPGLFSPPPASIEPAFRRSPTRPDEEHQSRRSVTPVATNRDVEQLLFFEDDEIAPSAQAARGLFESDGEDDMQDNHRIHWDVNGQSTMGTARDNIVPRAKRRRESDADESVVEPTQLPARGLFD